MDNYLFRLVDYCCNRSHSCIDLVGQGYVVQTQRSVWCAVFGATSPAVSRLYDSLSNNIFIFDIEQFSTDVRTSRNVVPLLTSV